jgi:antitoxin component YwqK of YwqJK toxin-antitoxin module
MKADAPRYSNGQIGYEQTGDTLTYYQKDGSVKATGKCINGSFEGEWKTYKKEGYLWVVGHFKNNKKHGKWTRYKADGSIEKEELFEDGKKTK